MEPYPPIDLGAPVVPKTAGDWTARYGTTILLAAP